MGCFAEFVCFFCLPTDGFIVEIRAVEGDGCSLNGLFCPFLTNKGVEERILIPLLKFNIPDICLYIATLLKRQCFKRSCLKRTLLCLVALGLNLDPIISSLHPVKGKASV